MDFRLTDEQQAFEVVTRDVAADLSLHRSEDLNWELLAEAGLMGLLVPEHDGGSGGSLVDAAIFAEQLGRHLAPGAVPGAALIAAAALQLVESTTQRRQLLEQLVAGQPTSVLVGRDLSWPPGREAVAWGWHTGAVVLAPAPRGLAPLDATEVEASLTADPTLAVGVVDSSILMVERSRELGERPVDRWFLAAANVITSSLLVGHMGAALDLAVEYAKEREQFGVKIGSFQAIKHLCADMLVDLEASRSAAYGAAAIVGSVGDVERATRSAATAKAWCGDAAIRVCENALQVHGGMGFTWECAVHRYLRAAHVTRASFMSADQALDVVAGSMAWT